MIDFREGDYITPLVLPYLINLNPILLQLHGIDHEGDSMHEIWLGGYLFRVFVFYEFVEFGFIGLWDDVPGLCAAPVVVVHRVYEQVFDMPTK